jgi:hypothetical protein
MQRVSRLALIAGAAATFALPVGAANWEGEIAAGVASSNASSAALALQGRLGVSFSHVSLSVRAVDLVGSGARDGRSAAFSGWIVGPELRLHTGSTLGLGRLHVAIATGVGREVAVSPGPFPDGDPGAVEVGRTGPAFLASTGGALKLGALALSVELAAFYWSRFETTAPGAQGPNGGLGGALLLGIGVLP